MFIFCFCCPPLLYIGKVLTLKKLNISPQIYLTVEGKIKPRDWLESSYLETVRFGSGEMQGGYVCVITVHCLAASSVVQWGGSTRSGRQVVGHVDK